MRLTPYHGDIVIEIIILISYFFSDRSKCCYSINLYEDIVFSIKFVNIVNRKRSKRGLICLIKNGMILKMQLI